MLYSPRQSTQLGCYNLSVAQQAQLHMLNESPFTSQLLAASGQTVPLLYRNVSVIGEAKCKLNSARMQLQKVFQSKRLQLLENLSTRKTDSCRLLARFRQSYICTTKGINISANLWNLMSFTDKILNFPVVARDTNNLGNSPR
jgi:hypothetical protein